jgi:hypothetical protein
VEVPNITSADARYVNVAGDSMTGGLTSSGNFQAGSDPTASLTGSLVHAAGVVACQRSTAGVNIQVFKSGTAFANGQHYVAFYGQTTATGLGAITQSGSTNVAYNTSSDPRLKTVDGPADDAAAIAQALGAAAFRGHWIDPQTGQPEGDQWVMLSSHDIEDVAPYAVFGDRDATDDDGNIVAQQVNYPGLVPLLFAALSQALERIAALEAAA